MKPNMTLKELQAYIKEKDFNPEQKHAYFQKLIEEVGELAEALRKDYRMGDQQSIKGTINEELYDILYYVIGIANTNDIDLEQAFHLKDEINREKYES